MLGVLAHLERLCQCLLRPSGSRLLRLLLIVGCARGHRRTCAATRAFDLHVGTALVHSGKWSRSAPCGRKPSALAATARCQWASQDPKAVVNAFVLSTQ